MDIAPGENRATGNWPLVSADCTTKYLLTPIEEEDQPNASVYSNQSKYGPMINTTSPIITVTAPKGRTNARIWLLLPIRSGVEVEIVKI